MITQFKIQMFTHSFLVYIFNNQPEFDVEGAVYADQFFSVSFWQLLVAFYRSVSCVSYSKSYSVCCVECRIFQALVDDSNDILCHQVNIYDKNFPFQKIFDVTTPILRYKYKSPYITFLRKQSQQQNLMQLKLFCCLIKSMSQFLEELPRHPC